ncbi:MAG: alpha/beta fold hydrolase [Chloroflexota bacterium]|nr:alpha/beta fold hydrolase [Chloroflexota bacterium]
MTEPRIGFCTTSDGVRIAYATIGAGSPRVWVPAWVSHLALDWEDADSRADIEYWAARNTIVRYDKRGTGLSERKMEDYSIDARVLDLEAVVDDLKLKKFAVTGSSEGGPVAIAYAARHPERVSRLILMGTFAHGAGEGRGETIDAFAQLVEAEWGLGSQTVANLFLPSASADQLQRFAQYERDSASRHDAAAMIRALKDIDVSALLPKITAPTLVVHGRKDAVIPFALGCELASKIPNAQLFAFEGGHSGDANTELQLRHALEEFLTGGRRTKRKIRSEVTREDMPVRDPTIIVGPTPLQSFASGRYVVVRPLGEGGQKSVYLVHDNALDRDCALSMVKSELLEPDDLERLRREAQAMARLGAHSNIVTVHDIGEEDGKPYLVCEYVPAGELRRHLRDAGAPLSLERALAIAADIARALAVAHGRGVIHRDVKPANVWLCDDGSAKLGDFGLAFSLDRTRMTLPGSAMGTATYMSPEQARGEPADARTDLYALGVMLYEMVCGRPPFLGDDPLSVISQHASVAPAAPALHAPGLPPPLNDLILRLLAKPPDLRPASAALVLDELRAIAESLRAPDAAPEAEVSELEPAPAAPGFVGRTPELEQLAAALDRTIGGAGSLVMVVGEPGIGKTRLLEQFAAHARAAGVQVLNGHCYDGDWAPPFSPFVEAIKQHATTTPPQRLRAHLGADAGVLARIVPALHERLPNIAEPPAIPAEGERYRLLEAVSDTLGRLAAERPLVLVLDDLHWADKGTIAMLQQVARTSATQRVLLLGAYRDVELDRTHPLADALAGLRREKHFERIALKGLDGAEVAELLDAIAEQEVPAALSEAIARETDGNPFFIKEVLLHLVEERKIVQQDGTWTSKLSIAEMGIPEGVREVIGRRLSRVSETCGRMLTVASALTAGFSWDVISALTDADDATLLDAVDEALGAQLIVERERGRYDFTHALIRHTLYEELSTPRRVLLHRQIGEALERLYAADIEPHLAELAHHFYHAASSGLVEKAIDYARRAADDATRSVAYDVAVTQYEHALELSAMAGGDESERCRLLIALGEAQWKTGDAERSRESYGAAAEMAKVRGLTRELAVAALGYAGPPEYPWGGLEAIALLQDAVEAISSEEDRPYLAMVLARLELALPLAPTDPMRALRPAVLRYAPDGDLSARALEIAREAGEVGAIAYAIRTRLRVLWENDVPAPECRRLAEELYSIAQSRGDRGLLAWARTWLLGDLLSVGDMAPFDAMFAEYASLTRELHEALHVYVHALLEGTLSIMRGDFVGAERKAQEAFVIGNRAKLVDVVLEFSLQLFLIRREQGRIAEMESLVRSSVEQNPDSALLRSGFAILQLELGHDQEAREIYQPLAAAGFSQLGRGQFLPIILALLAEVAGSLGDGDGSALLYERLLPWRARQLGAASIVYGSASRQLGILAGTMSRLDDAQRHFEDALRMNTRMGARPYVARTQLDYARMLRKRDAPADAARARELLEQALATAREIGMAKVAADCEALLTAGG